MIDFSLCCVARHRTGKKLVGFETAKVATETDDCLYD
jgi:hypothetical protein